MRIAYLHSGSIPSVYANGVHVMRMCDALTDAGHDVRLYALRGEMTSEDVHAYYGTRNRFPVRTFPMRAPVLLGSWLRAWGVRRAIRRDGVPDLLYGRDPHALVAARGLAPRIYETHLLWDSRMMRAIERVLLGSRSVRGVVFVSQALADDYAGAFHGLDGADGPALVTAHDCANPPPPGPAAQLPGRPGALKVGYVGHLYPGRGIEVILGLADRVPEADFHVVGGTASDLAHWRMRADHPHLHFHGHRPPGSLHPYYRAFDIVLAPYQQQVACAGGVGDISRWVSPMKLFEYMSHGLAVVASDLPVLREVMADDVNCLLVPPADLDAWERAVRRLAAEPALRARLGGEARDQLLTEYTWRRRADRVLTPVTEPTRPAGPAATDRADR
ncbi:glycosyltransferase family 4 protein [Streptomyces sp. NPDC048248]|uniref:glycosyltransferase family 4 protein n=1 Tax=Streptomyces sp. NPDC048248 TaxID=3365523 RepID=UPI00371C6270